MKQIINVYCDESCHLENDHIPVMVLGAVTYVNRGLEESSAKVALVQLMKRRSGYSLTRTTLLRENKVNIFRWHASEAPE